MVIIGGILKDADYFKEVGSSKQVEPRVGWWVQPSSWPPSNSGTTTIRILPSKFIAKCSRWFRDWLNGGLLSERSYVKVYKGGEGAMIAKLKSEETSTSGEPGFLTCDNTSWLHWNTYSGTTPRPATETRSIDAISTSSKRHIFDRYGRKYN